MVKKVRIFVFAICLLLCAGIANAQENYNTAQKSPTQMETVLGKECRTRAGHDSYQSAYRAALMEARQAYPSKTVAIRNLTRGELKITGGDILYLYNYTVVELPSATSQKLIETINRATSTIEEGNRFALDQIIIATDDDRNIIRSQIVNALKSKGFKVIAKEQLEKLYKEWKQTQETPIYNPETLVKPNNFSAVGYFISVRITSEYLQVQVVNVSTSEIEGDITVNM